MALNPRQAEKLGEKLLDLGNIAVGGLTFGSMLSEKGFQWPMFVGGVLFWIFSALVGLRMLREGG